MRIQEILIESHQLDEGPILNKIGTAVGKGVGTLAKGVGAVAGGVAGLGSAVKKGFRAGKATVGGAGDDPAAAPAAGGAAPGGTTAAPAAGGAAPAAGGAPAGKPKGFLAGVKAGQSQGMAAFPNADEEDPEAAPPAAATTPPSATDINKAGPKGTAQAKPIQGTVAKQAAAKTGAALASQDQAQAGQTMYSQVKANVDKLDKKGKQRILQLLQKSLAQPAAEPGAMGQAAGQLAKGGAAPNTMANAPVSKTNTAKPGNPNAAPASVAPIKPAAEPTAPAAPEKAAPGATTPAPSGEKTIDNPVATVGTKRATNIGKPTFDTQTGKSLPGQALNNVRKKAEYGTNALGATRKKIKAGAAQPENASKINTGSMVLEGFSLFRKK
jgi:hypothetical protein